MRGRLELSIRSLPEVVACTVTGEDIFVLAAPDADRAQVEATVLSLIGHEDGSPRVRVLGGTEPLTIQITEPSLRRWALTAGTAAAALMLAVGSMGTVGTQSPVTEQAAPPQTVYPLELPRFEQTPIRAVAATGQADEPVFETPAIEVPEPEIAPAIVRTIAPEELPRIAAESCRSLPDRGAPRAQRGEHRGNGPAPHSRSVLLPPSGSCERGRA